MPTALDSDSTTKQMWRENSHPEASSPVDRLAQLLPAVLGHDAFLLMGAPRCPVGHTA